jgi:hypothetical protein
LQGPEGGIRVAGYRLQPFGAAAAWLTPPSFAAANR